MVPLPHDDYGSSLVVTSWLLVLLSAVFLFLRVLLKLSHHRGLWWDDYILLTSWITLTVGVILNVISVGLGYGKHTWDVPPTNVPKIIVNGTVSGTLFILAAAWSKTSFALTLLRLPIGSMRHFIWFIIVSLNLAMHLSALSIFIECIPDGLPPGTPLPPTFLSSRDSACLPVSTAIWFGIFVAGYSAAADFTLALLPWKFLWKLQMEKKEKIGILVAMSMGVFAGLSAVLKATKLMTLESPDVIDGVSLAAWAEAEVGVTIMAASIPILRALFRRPSPLPRHGAGGGASDGSTTQQQKKQQEKSQQEQQQQQQLEQQEQQQKSGLGLESYAASDGASITSGDPLVSKGDGRSGNDNGKTDGRTSSLLAPRAGEAARPHSPSPRPIRDGYVGPPLQSPMTWLLDSPSLRDRHQASVAKGSAVGEGHDHGEHTKEGEEKKQLGWM